MSWLPEVFDKAAGKNNSRTALIEEDKKWTFDELASEVDSIAATLREKVPGKHRGNSSFEFSVVRGNPVGNLESR
jgi:acyl-CoA synthetase (AMP-forming)/AMP-acid ligase II